MTSTFFLGACTPQGFLSHYDSLFDELEQLYIIKGGSGCGKSTFMRKIGAEARKDIEELLDPRVYLQLWVKVKEGWRNNQYQMRNFGYEDQ